MKAIPVLLAVLLLALPAFGETNYPPQSIYQLDAVLEDQSGRQIGLDAHRGRPVLVTMFYGSCHMTCPMIIDTLRAIEREAGPRAKNLRVLMISIDPEHDTPAKLLSLAQQRKLDLSRWTLARTDEATVRRIAALLNVQYRQLPNGGFNHSNVIALLSPEGELVAHSSMLGKVDPDLLQRL